MGNFVFHHTDNPSGTHLTTTFDETYTYGGDTDVSLAQTLGRAVRLGEWEWTTIGNFREEILPWASFFLNSHIADKVKNYRHVRGHLKLRFIITGNPSLYGRVICAYHPRATRDVYPLCGNLSGARTSQISMMPHVFLDPSTGQGAEMTLPFFCPENWLDLTAVDATSDMGSLYISSMNPLRHASGNPGKAQISVYGWMEDAELCTPTAAAHGSVVYQSAEHATSPVSKTATAVAKAAGALSRIPYFEPYALATSTVASAIAGVAHAFGFSRPPILNNDTVVYPRHAGDFCTLNTHEPILRLGADVAGELTLDPRTVGLDSVDEMAISSIVQRECYHDEVFWPSTHVRGDSIWEFRVSPSFQAVDTTVSPNRGVLTPMTGVAQLFKYWKGSITFKFQVAASAFHRGKLLLRYDPAARPQAGADTVLYSRVIDISGMKDFEITIPWHNPQGWLEVNQMSPGDLSNTGSASSVVFNPVTDNGVLRLEVFDPLTSPDDSISPSLPINVFVKGGEDLEFAFFTGTVERSTPRSTNVAVQPQAALDGEGLMHSNEPEVAAPVAPAGDLNIDPNKHNLVYMGESIPSLRLLAKRYRVTGNSTTFDAREPISSTSTMHTLEYIMSMYVGWRGSKRAAIRSASATGALSAVQNALGGCPPLAIDYGTMKCEMPFYSNKRFEHCRTNPDYAANTDTRTLSANNLSFDIVGASNSLHVAAGEDFTCFFFIGLPPLYGF